MKQSAFESPTNENQTNALNAGSGGTPFATAAGKDAVLTQRQRLRKTGPFVVHSQSIPDSRTKYAGSWPPPQYESDSDNNNASAQPTASSGPKTQVGILYFITFIYSIYLIFFSDSATACKQRRQSLPSLL